MPIRSNRNLTEYYDRFSYSGAGGPREYPVALWTGARGVQAGGHPGSPNARAMDYITIDTTGNASDFGDILSDNGRKGPSSSSSGIRGILCGGEGTPGAVVDTISYVTIGTLGNAVDFGSTTIWARGNGCSSGCASGDDARGIWTGGVSQRPTIEYVNINITGSTVGDFGDCNTERVYDTSLNCNGTRALIAGGMTPSLTNEIEYITINTTGNGIDFGDLTVARYGLSAAPSTTRATCAGGRNQGVRVIDYWTMATLGNATDFGDLSEDRGYNGSGSNLTRGICAGGYGPSSAPTGSQSIDYYTISVSYTHLTLPTIYSV